MAEIEGSRQIGIAAAKLMQKLEDDYPEEVKVLDAIVVVEIEIPLPEDDEEAGKGEADEDYLEVYDYYSTSPRRSVILGIISGVLMTIRENFGRILIVGEDDEDEPDT